MDLKKKESMSNLKIHKKLVRLMLKTNSNIRLFLDRISNLMILFTTKCWVRDHLVRYFWLKRKIKPLENFML